MSPFPITTSVILVTSALALLTPLGSSQCEQHLRSSDADSGDRFGGALALDGNTLVVGAWGDDLSGFELCGAAYFFEYGASGWVEVARFTPPDPTYDMYFGESVAIQGDLALVGAPNRRHPGPSKQFAGSVFVYRRSASGWSLVEELRASDAAAWNRFGAHVDFDGERAIVSTFIDEPAPVKVYIFDRAGDGLSETAILSVDLPNDDHVQVQISGTTAFLGAPWDTGTSGKVLVFEETGGAWSLAATLLPNVPVPIGLFGRALALEGDRALIGEPGHMVSGFHRGACYVFERSGTNWVKTGLLTASDGQEHDSLGESVALDGDLVLVGAPHVDDPQFYSGSAYLYAFDGVSWNEEAEIQDPHAHHRDESGSAVALENRLLVTSRPYDDAAGGYDIGEVYTVVHGSGGKSVCTSTTNSTGLAGTIAYQSSLSLADNDLRLIAEHLPPNQFGLFYYGAISTEIAFGDGYRCIGGQVFRYPPQSTLTGGVTRQVDYEDPPQEAGRIFAGSTWYFQFWFRDPAAGASGWNLTDALSLTFCF